MESIIKIAAIAIIAALCAVAVKKYTPELGLILSLIAGMIILFFSLDSIKDAVALMNKFSDMAKLSPAIVSPVIKTVGIAIITHIAAEICKDAKEGGLASFVEIAGAAGSLIVCMPLLETVLAMITELL